ncbi:substrate-binding domain-containing protein [Desulfitobacterium sp.]|uniref:substrate-binding domain-containing protein n=1 Tax=Desulfitobacterium sp. TaxID=49981 RepID=UPI002BC6F540|nr:substrate-binding domain-containing protein [Desulfitobacterium sp.]HVJ49355.1 substrate-binding domain-containing protein [Desulfitobacterium sp.]
MLKKIKSRKTISTLLATLVILVLALTGCGTTQTPQPQAASTPTPANPNLILATTTSTQDSGLLEVLIPEFQKKTGYTVKTVAVGTGAALAMGEKGDADVLLVHAPSSEKKLVDNQTMINYNLVMHNDFVLVGPASDPAKIKGMKTSVEAFKAIEASQSVFMSRGDRSGTDTMEKSLWAKANLKPAGKWYQETGSGMGQTLTMASDKASYTLTDRATFLANQKNLKLEILVQGEAALLNIYHVGQVNPEKFPKVNQEGAKAFVNFMLDPDTQKTIGEFGKDTVGQALFFPDAGKKMEDLGK